jgi:iron uptake system EfeUOB component EfeO/EfeM
MAVAFTMMGLVLGLLGILCTYVWKGNHKMEKAIMESLKILEEGQKEIAQMLLTQTRILERIEGKIPTPSV